MGARSPRDIISGLFLKNSGVKVIAKNNTNIEKQPVLFLFFYILTVILVGFHFASLLLVMAIILN